MLHLKEQQLLQYDRKLQEQDAELKKYQDKQHQMEQLLQQLQRQIQQKVVVHVQPSVSINIINPQPGVQATTPTTVEHPGMRDTMRSQPPAAVTASMSAPVNTVLHVSHVSLHQHIAAVQVLPQHIVSVEPGSIPVVSSMLPRNAFTAAAPTYHVSYAAVVQPL